MSALSAPILHLSSLNKFLETSVLYSVREDGFEKDSGMELWPQRPEDPQDRERRDTGAGSSCLPLAPLPAGQRPGRLALPNRAQGLRQLWRVGCRIRASASWADGNGLV